MSITDWEFFHCAMYSTLILEGHELQCQREYSAVSIGISVRGVSGGARAKRRAEAQNR
jgi:hypothetical protein